MIAPTLERAPEPGAEVMTPDGTPGTVVEVKTWRSDDGPVALVEHALDGITVQRWYPVGKLATVLAVPFTRAEAAALLDAVLAARRADSSPADARTLRTLTARIAAALVTLTAEGAA